MRHLPGPLDQLPRGGSGAVCVHLSGRGWLQYLHGWVRGLWRWIELGLPATGVEAAAREGLNPDRPRCEIAPDVPWSRR